MASVPPPAAPQAGKSFKSGATITLLIAAAIVLGVAIMFLFARIRKQDRVLDRMRKETQQRLDDQDVVNIVQHYTSSPVYTQEQHRHLQQYANHYAAAHTATHWQHLQQQWQQQQQQALESQPRIITGMMVENAEVDVPPTPPSTEMVNACPVTSTTDACHLPPGLVVPHEVAAAEPVVATQQFVTDASPAVTTQFVATVEPVAPVLVSTQSVVPDLTLLGDASEPPAAVAPKQSSGRKRKPKPKRAAAANTSTALAT